MYRWESSIYMFIYNVYIHQFTVYLYIYIYIADTHCDTDMYECASLPCQHGTCTDLVNGYTCACVDGYTGMSWLRLIRFVKYNSFVWKKYGLCTTNFLRHWNDTSMPWNKTECNIKRILSNSVATEKLSVEFIAH